MDTYYIDGRFVDEDRAYISVKDLALLRGFGVFEFLVTYNKKPFRLQDHLDRLWNSASYVGLSLYHTRDELYGIVLDTIARNTHHKELGVRIVYTGGISSDGVTPEEKGSLIVMVLPRPCPLQWWYTKGAKTITVEAGRYMPQAKSTNYLSAICAQREAKRQGAIEALYVDQHNCILEGTTTNVFFCKAGKLITPHRDVLPGVTRKVILELVQGHIEVVTRDVHRAEVGEMEEAFICSSSKEVVPIVLMDDVVIGNGTIGKTTREVMQLFRRYTNAYGEGSLSHEHS